MASSKLFRHSMKKAFWCPKVSRTVVSPDSEALPTLLTACSSRFQPATAGTAWERWRHIAGGSGSRKSGTGSRETAAYGSTRRMPARRMSCAPANENICQLARKQSTTVGNTEVTHKIVRDARGDGELLLDLHLDVVILQVAHVLVPVHNRSAANRWNTSFLRSWKIGKTYNQKTLKNLADSSVVDINLMRSIGRIITA